MCLGIPGQIVEMHPYVEHLARIDVNGVGRTINIGLLEDEHLAPGDWVLIHVGFAMSKSPWNSRRAGNLVRQPGKSSGRGQTKAAKLAQIPPSAGPLCNYSCLQVSPSSASPSVRWSYGSRCNRAPQPRPSPTSPRARFR